MKAGIISTAGEAPYFGEFSDPEPKAGSVMIDVSLVGLGGWDVRGAYRLGVSYPCVVRAEGIGHTADGRRVYFGERSDVPYGGWAERTIVPEAEVWEVPDSVSDKLALNMGIAATGIFLPLRRAAVQSGESVLIVGATGVVGQIGLQIARVLGAGRIVAAGRSRDALDKLLSSGLVDAVVVMEGDVEKDAAALKSAAGSDTDPLKSYLPADAAALLHQAPREGFDVVIDLVCGPPLLAAIKATRWGARIFTIGRSAGDVIALNMRDLLFRQLGMFGTGQRLASDREQVWRELLKMGQAHNFQVAEADYPFEAIAAAWEAQRNSAHAKITARVPR